MKALTFLGGFILLAALITIFFVPVRSGSAPGGRWCQARMDVSLLVNATKYYKSEYDTFPQGDKKTVLKALQGNNEKRIVFVELDTRRLSRNGEYLDPWGSPYFFDLSRGPKPWAYSFGKNKVDEGGTGDDVASWKEL